MVESSTSVSQAFTLSNILSKFKTGKMAEQDECANGIYREIKGYKQEAKGKIPAVSFI